MNRSSGETSPVEGSGAALHAGTLTATRVGLIIALVITPMYAVIVRPLLIHAGVDELVEIFVGLAVLWVFAGLLVVVVRRGEQAPWASVGIRRTASIWVLTAVGAGILLSLLVPVLSLLIGGLLPAANANEIRTVATSQPWALIMVAVVTAAVTEELLFRAYPIERLLARFGSRWIAVLIPLVPFTAMHAQGWNIAHVIAVVIPMGLALSALYLWRRNLLMVVVAHLLIDAPLVAISITQG